jgi:hypothetical protein
MMRLFTLAALAASLAMPTLAQEQQQQQQPGTVTTHATARALLANTVADVAIGVEAHARTVPAVQAALAQGSDRLLDFLRAEKVERLRTEQVAVTPETEPVRGQPDRIAGYGGRMRLTFRVPADRLGAVLGGALDKGGNALESTSLVPREAELDASRQQLAAEAVRTALAQARAVAEAAGRRLGAVRQIQVDPGYGLPRPAPMMAAARMTSVAAPPIATEAGESEVAATVSVTVNLVEP